MYNDYLTDTLTNEGFYQTDRVAAGNYKNVNLNVLASGYNVNDDIKTTRTHDTGVRADIDVQLEIMGSVNDFEELANIAVYCKCKKWFFENDNLNYHIIGGIANKFHGVTSLLKNLKKYSHVEIVTGDVYDTNTNDYLFTTNLNGVDVVKTLQKLDRGFLYKLITERPDFTAFNK